MARERRLKSDIRSDKIDDIMNEFNQNLEEVKNDLNNKVIYSNPIQFQKRIQKLEEILQGYKKTLGILKTLAALETLDEPPLKTSDESDKHHSPQECK